MKSPKKISIITVVFNDLVGLEKTRQSILAQVCEDYEWIICDGGSSAELVFFLESLGRSAKWVSEPDHGIYDAMNRGVSMCSGDYVVFMNAGDTFHDSETLARVTKKLSTAGEQTADILFGGAMLSFANGSKMVYRPPKRVEDYIWHGLPANHQATFYRRELLGVTPYDLQYRICGDYFLAAKLMIKGARAVYLNEPLASFEVGGVSYKSRRHLFAEPYRIQRDLLGIPLHYRLVSMCKRVISTVGFVLLSQSLFQKKKYGGG